MDRNGSGASRELPPPMIVVADAFGPTTATRALGDKGSTPRSLLRRTKPSVTARAAQRPLVGVVDGLLFAVGGTVVGARPFDQQEDVLREGVDRGALDIASFHRRRQRVSVHRVGAGHGDREAGVG